MLIIFWILLFSFSGTFSTTCNHHKSTTLLTSTISVAYHHTLSRVQNCWWCRIHSKKGTLICLQSEPHIYSYPVIVLYTIDSVTDSWPIFMSISHLGQRSADNNNPPSMYISWEKEVGCCLVCWNVHTNAQHCDFTNASCIWFTHTSVRTNTNWEWWC